MKDKDNYYFKIHSKSNNGSAWHIVHSLNDLHEFLKLREENMGFGDELTITRAYGWDEKEREELERLKAKYEPTT